MKKVELRPGSDNGEFCVDFALFEFVLTSPLVIIVDLSGNANLRNDEIESY